MNEMLCTWPNGERREVVVAANDGKQANIFWNERVETDRAAVTGYQDKVPSEWLSPIEER